MQKGWAKSNKGCRELKESHNNNQGTALHCRFLKKRSPGSYLYHKYKFFTLSGEENILSIMKVTQHPQANFAIASSAYVPRQLCIPKRKGNSL